MPPLEQAHEPQRTAWEESLQAASANLALAQQEKALALLGEAADNGDERGFQHAWLHALAAQRQPLAGREGLDLRGLGGLAERLRDDAFALRWRSPTLWLGGPVAGVAWTPDGALLATAGADGQVRRPSANWTRPATATSVSWPCRQAAGSCG